MRNTTWRARRRRVVVLATAATVMIGLGGCSLLGTGPSAPSRSATASASASAVADGVRFTDRPDQTGMPDCSAVLPAGLTSRLVPAIADDDPVTEQQHVDTAAMAALAVGGLSCNVDNGVAPMDDVLPGRQGDPMRNGITATVLPDASDDLAAYLSSDVRIGDPVSCAASDAARLSCTADVHAGSAWLHVAMERVQDATDVTPEGMGDRFQALVVHATSAVEDSALGTEQVSHERGTPGPSICVTTRVDAVTSTPLADTWGATDWQDDIGWVSLERAGGEWCDFHPASEQQYTSVAARYGTLPGGSWVVQARIEQGLIDPDDRIDLDGLGAADAAYRTCDDTLCTVDVVHGGDWTRYLLKTAVAADTSAAIETWARSSFGQ